VLVDNDLTIITINFNNSTGLSNTIESVKRQTNKNFKYIIIDGGSNIEDINIINNNLDIINEFISEKDNGIFDAMNKGIKKVITKHLMFLNSGDIFYDNDSVNLILNSVSNEFDIIAFDLVIKSTTDKKYRYIAQFNDNFNHYAIPHLGSIFKREIFDKYGMYQTSYKIISDLLYAIKNYNYLKIKITNQIIVEMSAGGISTRRSLRHDLEKFVLIINYKITFIKKIMEISLTFKHLIKDMINYKKTYKN
jgi:glycosyltransferase involved in cell wall biosynthesis